MGGTNKGELYILPDENNNLMNDASLAARSIKRELHENLMRWFKAYPVRSDKNSKMVPLDANKIKALKSLGYIQ